MMLLSGDVVFTARPGLIGNLIRICERSKGEAKSVVEHVGIVGTPGTVFNATIIESLPQGTVERCINAYLKGDVSTCIYRNRNLTEPLRNLVSYKARSYVGKKYGYLKILAHAGDYLIGGRYFFRKLCKLEKYPICSWVVGHAYQTVNYWFKNLDPDMVQPDDIWDDVKKNDLIWELVTTI